MAFCASSVPSSMALYASSAVMPILENALSRSRPAICRLTNCLLVASPVACIREMVSTMAWASAWPFPKPADVSAHSWIISAAFLALYPSVISCTPICWTALSSYVVLR